MQMFFVDQFFNSYWSFPTSLLFVSTSQYFSALQKYFWLLVNADSELAGWGASSRADYEGKSTYSVIHQLANEKHVGRSGLLYALWLSVKWPKWPLADMKESQIQSFPE